MTEDEPTCCAPTCREKQPSPIGDRAVGAALSTPPASDGDERTGAMVRLDGGAFRMGTDDAVGFPQDGEGPAL